MRRIDHLNALPKLKTIDFSNNRLTDTQGLENITSLETLKLDHNPISHISPSFVSFFMKIYNRRLITRAKFILKLFLYFGINFIYLI